MSTKLVNGILAGFGLEVRRKGRSKGSIANNRSTMIAGINRFKSTGQQIRTVVDVGAASGKWTLDALNIWPNAQFLLLEPLLERKSTLESFAEHRKNVHFSPVAAGSQDGFTEFIIADDLDGSGVASKTSPKESLRTVSVSSIPMQLAKHGLEGPFLIKLDVHGFEIPILNGCAPIMGDVQLFIIEVYGFKIADGALLFWEMCQHMDKLGFRLFDIVDVMNRPVDGAFWQCDAFFVPKSNPVFQYPHFK